MLASRKRLFAVRIFLALLTIFFKSSQAPAGVGFIPNIRPLQSFEQTPPALPIENVKTKVLVEWRNGGYFCQGKRVATKLIENLIIKSSEVACFGPHVPYVSNWLSKNSATAVSEYASKFTPYGYDYSYEHMLSGSFSNYWSRHWNSDTYGNPNYLPERIKTELTVKTNTGRTVRFISEKPYPQFFRWQVVHPNGDVLTFSNELSLAIAPVLHACASNPKQSQRLMRKCIVHDLVYNILYKRILEKEFSKKILSALKGTNGLLTINSCELSSRSEKYVKHLNRKVKLPFLVAILHSPCLPRNTEVKVTMDFDNYAQSALRKTLETHIERINSHGQLVKLIRKHPKHIFRLEYINGRNFAYSSSESFVRDFHQFNAHAGQSAGSLCANAIEIKTVGPKPNSLCAQWLLLADGRLVLWRHQGGHILSWPKEHFCKTSPQVTAKIIPWSKFVYKSKNWFGFLPW